MSFAPSLLPDENALHNGEQIPSFQGDSAPPGPKHHGQLHDPPGWNGNGRFCNGSGHPVFQFEITQVLNLK
jgi:hypothetical protein